MDYLKFFGNEYLSKLDGKKGQELFAIFHFLKNENPESIFKENFIVNPEEPADIIYSARKFQVTNGSPDESAVFGKLNKKEIAQSGNVEGEWLESAGNKYRVLKSTFNLDDELKDLVLRPLESKTKKYGDSRNPSLKNIELIIFSYQHPIPEFEITRLNNFHHQYAEYFRSRGYSKIYLVDQRNNILIFTLN